MPNMKWEKVRREELLKHDDVTLRTGRRQGIAESGPSSDGTPTRAERRQARLELLYGLDDCARGSHTVRLIVREVHAFLAFDSPRNNRLVPTTIVGGLGLLAIDVSIHCASPKELAKALRYQYSPKDWWPLRLELQQSSVEERTVLRARRALRVETPDAPAIRLTIGELSEDSTTRSSQAADEV